MNTETLRIHNFGGIADAEIDLSRMNIFIGPQASGKSVCAKLLFFFKEIIRSVASDVFRANDKTDIYLHHQRHFLAYFPAQNWPEGEFEIKYVCDDFWITVHRNRGDNDLDISYAEVFNALVSSGEQQLKRLRDADNPNDIFATYRGPVLSVLEDKMLRDAPVVLSNVNFFIPDGRSYFSSMQRAVFSSIANDIAIDPFVAEFGRIYEIVRSHYHSRAKEQRNVNQELAALIHKVIGGTYERIGNDYVISMPDGRRVRTENGSSGQQEALPLALTLLEISETARGASNCTLFIEEPEAHLYPTSQRDIVHMIAASANLADVKSSSQFIITTHSPYILTALNNLMYGEKINSEFPSKRDQVQKILNGASLIAPCNLRAYAFANGHVNSIIDQETQLVLADSIDDVSSELASDYESLVDLEFEEQTA